MPNLFSLIGYLVNSGRPPAVNVNSHFNTHNPPPSYNYYNSPPPQPQQMPSFSVHSYNSSYTPPPNLRGPVSTYELEETIAILRSLDKNGDGRQLYPESSSFFS